MPRYFNTTENDLLYAILVALTNVDPAILNAEYNSTNDLLAAILEAIKNGGGGGAVNAILNQFAVAQNASMWIGGPARIGDNVTFDKVIGLGNLNADPDTATNGQKYYNSVSLKERIYTGGAWHNVATEAFVFSSVVTGNTIYVDKLSANATDNRAGINKYSMTAPFKTIQAAMNAASAMDTIWISGGTYTENVNITARTIVLENSTISVNTGYVLTIPGAGTTLIYGFGSAKLENTGVAGGIINMTGTNAVGQVLLRHITAESINGGVLFNNGSGSASIQLISIFDSTITTKGDISSSTNNVLFNGKVEIRNSKLTSTNGIGFRTTRYGAGWLVENSQIDTYGYCLGSGAFSATDGSFTITNSTLTSRNSNAINNAAYFINTAPASRLTNSVIIQQTAIVFGGDRADSYGVLEVRDCTFYTTTGTYAISLLANPSPVQVKVYDSRSDKPIVPDLADARLTAEYRVVGLLSSGGVKVVQRTPVNSADAYGTEGLLTHDDNYIYIKTTTGWKRAALVAF